MTVVGPLAAPLVGEVAQAQRHATRLQLERVALMMSLGDGEPVLVILTIAVLHFLHLRAEVHLNLLQNLTAAAEHGAPLRLLVSVLGFHLLLGPEGHLVLPLASTLASVAASKGIHGWQIRKITCVSELYSVRGGEQRQCCPPMNRYYWSF